MVLLAQAAGSYVAWPTRWMRCCWRCDSRGGGMGSARSARIQGHRDRSDSGRLGRGASWQTGWNFYGGGTPFVKNPRYRGGDISWTTSAHISDYLQLRHGVRKITTGGRRTVRQGSSRRAISSLEREPEAVQIAAIAAHARSGAGAIVECASRACALQPVQV